MEDDQETDVNASLVEESSATPACAEPSGLVDAVRRLATDASAFFSQVAAWRRIPAVVARIVVSDDDALLPTDGVRRWIAAELRRLQTEADDGDLVDEELVDYTLGLLEHPEFAHPDLVVLELQEFLGREAATSFVLSLWRFLVMEIGLRHVHKTAAPPSTTSAAPQQLLRFKWLDVRQPIPLLRVPHHHCNPKPLTTSDGVRPTVARDRATTIRTTRCEKSWLRKCTSSASTRDANWLQSRTQSTHLSSRPTSPLQTRAIAGKR
ncbi:hypothetical protein PINS_up013419 [Pythium insidiosum]|nr:hypothetical protein PINS_up013419 [Pythium insidiosum]